MFLLAILIVVASTIIYLYIQGDISIKITPNSRIYDVVLYIDNLRKPYTIRIDGDFSILEVGNVTVYLPFSIAWMNHSVSLVKHNNEIVHLNLPDGAIFLYSAEQLNVLEIRVGNKSTHKIHTFSGKTIPFLEDIVEEI